MNQKASHDQFYDDDIELSGYPMPTSKQKSYKWQYFYIVALFFSVICNIVLYSQSAWVTGPGPPHGRSARNIPLHTVWNRFYWNTRWSQNHTMSDELWDNIKPSHGIVAVDRHYAATNGWAEAMYLPGDDSKGVYLLEAYHQLHCLKIIRMLFYEAVEGRPYTYPPKHAEHCFDALRQATVCAADNTPLYTFGDKTAGDGQIHKCRSWEQLRNWATDHTACYQDTIEDIPLREHFGHCDDGGDGIDDLEFRLGHKPL